ncbi:MAG TPA: hypothetical protein VKV17_21770 [Bryobacteraceae bacterium]|nr:hypothetical protein [Bryobacteraceae bacterium]
MRPGASVSPVREILENRLSGLLPGLESELDTFINERCLRARRALAGELNQAARRMRQAPERAAVAAILVEAATAFSAGAALLSIGESEMRGEQIRGVPDPCAATFRGLSLPMAIAPALAEAVRTRDPVTAMASPGEISGELASVLGRAPHERLDVCPLTVAGRVCALLCAWGDVDGPALELLAQVAAAAWQTIPPPAEIVQLTAPEAAAAKAQTPAPPPSAPPLSRSAPSGWDALSRQDRQIHLRAQRRARVAAAEMSLYAAGEVESGRARKDLYSALGSRIDAARESFHKQFFSATPTMVDYLHLELLHTLAHDDPDLLGKDYPGPLV